MMVSVYSVVRGPRDWLITLIAVDQKPFNTEIPPVLIDCDHTNCNRQCWEKYPQSRFPNWTLKQVERCKIHDAITKYDRTKQCIVYKLDVDKDGMFHDAGKLEMLDSSDEAVLDKEWNRLKDDNVCVFGFFLCRLMVIMPRIASTGCQSEGSVCGEYVGTCSAHAWRKVS